MRIEKFVRISTFYFKGEHIADIIVFPNTNRVVRDPI